MTEYGITLRRVFDAPRARVWQEWTEPERFADWFGGPDAAVPLETVSMDVRPGGTWRATMFADRGMIEWRGEYLEVVEPERLVITFSDGPHKPHELVTVILNDLGPARTEMLFEQRGHMRPDEYDYAKSGWSLFFDQMAARL
jgi:uncharacterized protein YndB with AHSA1/START domain